MNRWVGGWMDGQMKLVQMEKLVYVNSLYAFWMFRF